MDRSSRTSFLPGVIAVLASGIAACGGSTEPVATSSCAAEVPAGRLRIELSAELASATVVAGGRCGSFTCVRRVGIGCTAYEGNISGSNECEVRVVPAEGASLRAFATTATCNGTGAQLVFDDGGTVPPVTNVTSSPATESSGAPQSDSDEPFHTAEERF